MAAAGIGPGCIDAIADKRPGRRPLSETYTVEFDCSETQEQDNHGADRSGRPGRPGGVSRGPANASSWSDCFSGGDLRVIGLERICRASLDRSRVRRLRRAQPAELRGLVRTVSRLGHRHRHLQDQRRRQRTRLSHDHASIVQSGGRLRERHRSRYQGRSASRLSPTSIRLGSLRRHSPVRGPRSAGFDQPDPIPT